MLYLHVVYGSLQCILPDNKLSITKREQIPELWVDGDHWSTCECRHFLFADQMPEKEAVDILVSADGSFLCCALGYAYRLVKEIVQ